MAFILRRNLPWRRRSGAPSHQTTHLSVIAPDFSGRTVISFQHVWKRYPNGTDALRDINLSVPEGDFVFLVGPSGAGKSSLVRLLIREERPTKGKIFVNGVELGRMKRRKLPHFRRKVGLVFQDFKLLPQMTVHENVAFALVEVLPELEESEEREIEVNPDDLRIDTYRSTGAGGQHVNKTDSAVRITHLPTGIVVTSQNERSQMKNRDSAMKVLKSRLFQRQQEESARKREELRGSVMPAEFGSQIRNYVLQPYTLVKDVRTGVEVGNVQSVLEDGDMEPFTEGWLRWRLGQ